MLNIIPDDIVIEPEALMETLRKEIGPFTTMLPLTTTSVPELGTIPLFQFVELLKLPLPVNIWLQTWEVMVTVLLVALVQLFAIFLREYDPTVFTTMLWVVAPLLHKLPVVAEEVRVVEPPKQKEEAPEIVGVCGNSVTVTETGFEAKEVQPLAMV